MNQIQTLEQVRATGKENWSKRLKIAPNYNSMKTGNIYRRGKHETVWQKLMKILYIIHSVKMEWDFSNILPPRREKSEQKSGCDSLETSQ